MNTYLNSLNQTQKTDAYLNIMEILVDTDMTDDDKWIQAQYKLGLKNEPVELDGEGEEHFCKRCIQPMMVNEQESFVVCCSCGLTKPIFIFYQNYADKTYERTGYLYKRITHLRKHWRKFQDLCGFHTRLDHLKDRVEIMFKAIESPFRKYKPDSRHNFFNYKYLLIKFFEIMNRPDLASKLEYLKSREKLKQHDEIWAKICADFGWKFIPSIRKIPHRRIYKKKKKKKKRVKDKTI